MFSIYRLVELVSRPGERRDYYRVRPDAWANTLQDRLEQARAFRQLAEQGLAILAGAELERCRRLEEMRSLYALLEREIPRLLEGWEEERKTHDVVQYSLKCREISMYVIDCSDSHDRPSSLH